MKSCKNLKGGLQEVATELEVARIGPQHQAGSDSLLTGQTFFKMKEMFFEDDIDDSKVRRRLLPQYDYENYTFKCNKRNFFQ